MEAEKEGKKREVREQANRLGNTAVTGDTGTPLIHEGLAPGPSLDTNISRCSGPLYKMIQYFHITYIYTLNHLHIP